MIWTRPKQIGPIQNEWYLSKIIWFVQNRFGAMKNKTTTSVSWNYKFGFTFDVNLPVGTFVNNQQCHIWFGKPWYMIDPLYIWQDILSHIFHHRHQHIVWKWKIIVFCCILHFAAFFPGILLSTGINNLVSALIKTDSLKKVFCSHSIYLPDKFY